MKWLDNLKNITATGKPGKCPVCGSENTDYACTVIDKSNKNGCMDIWCTDCKRAFHVSRMQISNNLKTAKVPEGLKY